MGRDGRGAQRDVRAMPDYADILRFLAKNPPQIEAERALHASLLELLAKCLRGQERSPVIEIEHEPASEIAADHRRWVRFG